MRQYPHTYLIEQNGLYLYVLEYLDTMLEIGRSECTHKRHQSALREFLLWCSQHEVTELSELSRDTLKLYRRYIHRYRKSNGEPLAKGSINSKLTPVKTFCQWCTREHHIYEDIAHDFEIPAKPRGLPSKVLMHEAIISILKQPDTRNPEGLRDRAMMEVLYCTGIRRSELVGLALGDLDSVRMTLQIRGSKNGLSRYVPISEGTLKWILRYQAKARPRLLKGDDPGYLFLSHTGMVFQPGTLAARVKKYMNQAGVEVKGACHVFRHSVATQMLENGANIRYIQALLGHKDLNTTEIYTHVSIQKLREVHKNTHPNQLTD